MGKLAIEDRIARWTVEPASKETEGHIELLVAAEDELRRLRRLVTARLDDQCPEGGCHPSRAACVCAVCGYVEDVNG